MNLYFILGIHPSTGEVIVINRRPFGSAVAAERYLLDVNEDFHPFIVTTVERP